MDAPRRKRARDIIVSVPPGTGIPYPYERQREYRHPLKMSVRKARRGNAPGLHNTRYVDTGGERQRRFRVPEA